MVHHRSVEGVVIRRANVGEADRILTILTPEGKLSIVARGIRKLTSRKGGALELFNVVELLLSVGRSLPLVQEVQIVRSFPRLRLDFTASAQAYWAGELIDRLVGEDTPSQNLYDGMLTYLGRVNDTPDPLDIRSFELLVMSELGWQPELSHCVQCRQPLAPGKFAWSDKLGGVIDTTCSQNQEFVKPISQEAVKVLRLLSENGFGVSQRINLSSETEREVAELLHHYLELLGERAWQSPLLMEQAAPRG